MKRTQCYTLLKKKNGLCKNRIANYRVDIKNRIVSICDLHLDIHHGLKVMPSTIPNAGLGLFAIRNFKKGERIGCYASTDPIVHTSKLSDDNDYYLSLEDTDYHIDASNPDTSTVLRYVNDPIGTSMEENIRVEGKPLLHELPRYAFHALKDIIASRETPVELLWSYGDNYWIERVDNNK